MGGELEERTLWDRALADGLEDNAPIIGEIET